MQQSVCKKDNFYHILHVLCAFLCTVIN